MKFINAFAQKEMSLFLGRGVKLVANMWFTSSYSVH